MIATLVLALRIAMAIALFSFLGWALFTLWRDIRQQANTLSARRTPIIFIDVQSNSETIAQKRFTENEVLIGRDKNCALIVADEAVSAQHAHLTYHHGQWWLADMNSKNGTFLNSEKIAVATVLTSGDEFKCGGMLFRVRIGLEDASIPAQQLETGGSA